MQAPAAIAKVARLNSHTGDTPFFMNMRLAIAPLALVLAACQPTTNAGSDAPVTLEDDGSKFSYAAGYEIGQRLQSMGGVDIAPEAMMAGLKDALASEDARLDAAEMNAVKTRVYKAASDKRNAEREAKSEEAKAKGEAFLAENKAKEGVQVTESGLQYEVLTAGEGDSPVATDTVKVHYRGTLIDGTEFDSSYSRNQPATFRLNGVIKGWTEGLQLMKPGGKTRFVIPSELAYGSRGAGASIGPNETLIFEVELLEVQKAEDKAAGGHAEGDGHDH